MIRCEKLPVVGPPFWSFAGVNRARRLMIEQVAVSRLDDPEDAVTEQSLTRPSVPIVRRTAVVP